MSGVVHTSTSLKYVTTINFQPLKTPPAPSSTLSASSTNFLTLQTQICESTILSLPPLQPTSADLLTSRPQAQPSTASTRSVITTTSVLTKSLEPSPQSGSPTTGNSKLDLQTIGIITGAVVASTLIITICIVIVLAFIIVCNKPKHHLKREDSLTGNDAYGTTTNIHLRRDDSLIGNAAYGTTPQPSTVTAATYRKGDTYDYPRFGNRLLKSARRKHNKAQNTAIVLENCPGNVYTMSITSQKNIAYGTSVSSNDDGFQHPTNITSEANLTYINSDANAYEIEEYSYVRYRD